jgi:hypothetical protein
MRWLSRFATPAVQRAHKRVSDTNARLVRLLITRNAEVERLIQERNQANAALAELQLKQQRAKETYERIRAAEKDITAQRIAELDDLREQVEALRTQLEEATGPDAVSVDNDRLARELTAEREAHAETRRSLTEAAQEVLRLRVRDGVIVVRGGEDSL